jgi:glucose-6-phosphate 1-dehydrogenase
VKLVFLADHYIFKESVLNLKNRDFSKLYIKNLEKVGLENRVYYDSVGALRDMVQSHFFNILFRLIKFNLKDIQIRDYQRKQYKSYTIDLGKKSETETYVKLVLKIKGKEVIFETGKGFDQKDSTISIDGKTYDLASGKDPYEVMFDDFFLDKREHFPTMENAILAWKIIQKIEKMKDRLELY